MVNTESTFAYSPSAAGASAKRNRSSSNSSDRPYSPYNLYYILEHRLLKQERGVDTSKEDKDALEDGPKKLELIRKMYGDIQVPPLPARYQSIIVSTDWFVHGKKKNNTKRRIHRKTHGKIGFKELSRIMGANWKTVDDETRNYVKNLSNLVCRKWDEKKQRLVEEGKMQSNRGDDEEKMSRHAEEKKPAADDDDASCSSTFDANIFHDLGGSDRVPAFVNFNVPRNDVSIGEVDMSDREILAFYFEF